MGLRVRVIRGLALAGLVLGGAFVGIGASLTTAGYAVALWVFTRRDLPAPL